MAPKLKDIFSISKRIIESDPRHYLTLSFIFLLPLSFSSLLFQLLLNHFQQQQKSTPILFLSLFYFLFSSFFSLSATSSITYSVYHAFFNKKVKLQEAIQSITTSFFPLLATSIVISVVSFFLLFITIFVFFLVFFATLMLRGFDFDNTSDHFVVIIFTIILMIVLLPVVAYVQIKWNLVIPIVVVESRWGLEPLRRSASLVKGMRRLVVSSFVFFGVFGGLFFGIYYYISSSLVVIFVISPFNAMLVLFQIAVNTVLYIYCKQNHGEVLEDDKLGKEENEVTLSLIPS